MTLPLASTVRISTAESQSTVSPWRREKNDNEMIARVPPRFHEVLVTAVDEFDRRVNVRDIPRRQIEDGRLDLKTDTSSTRQVPQNRVETVA